MSQRTSKPTKSRSTRTTPPSGSGDNVSHALSAGFAFMSLVPILLAVFLVIGQEGGGTLGTILGGRTGALIVLMLISSVGGFFFIRRELVRTFQSVMTRASESATGDLSEHIREASAGEMSRISETIQGIAKGMENQAEDAARSRDRLRSGVCRLTQALQAARSQDQLWQGLVEGALDAVNGRTAYLMCVDEAVGDFLTVAAAGEESAVARETKVPLGEGVPGLAARERKPVLLGTENGKGDAHGVKVPECTLAVPMFRGETLQGVLIVQGSPSGDTFTEDDLTLAASLASLAAASMGQQDSSERLEDTLDQVLRAFATSVEERDPYARGHASRVAHYCEEMARSLNLDDETVRTVRRAAYIHDIGKLAIPETLLRKEGRFTDEELEHVRAHVITAEKVLARLPSLASLAPMVRHHHERCDGSGYPDGLQGDAIPLTTHVLIVANAFDVMTSDRSYRQAMSLSMALDLLKTKAGSWYDRRAVHALLALDEKVLKATGELDPNQPEKAPGAPAISVRH
ncbi:MAG: hypothetical protein DHS20C21_15220 [Gemmatimonadota bacterium]|nr:MAG: hypothetical protein DHS20C21_15220 [Gemmatimonadota bacterium]